MTGAAWVLLALAALAAAGNWTAVARGSQLGIYLCKPATLALLLATALALDPAHADARTWFALALALSLVGDVLLMLPQDVFVAGLGAFLLAHVAYTTGLDLHSDGRWLLAVPVVVVALVLGRRLLHGVRAGGEPGMTGPITAYVLVITVMVASALASGNGLAAAGALLFMTSDALIGETRFVAPRRWGPLAIIVTYHLGQALLVVSLVR